MRGTKIEIGGKERTLRYDMNAWADIGDKLGITVRLAHLQDDLLERPLPLSAVRSIVWAGLIGEDPDLTEREVGSWIDAENLGEVIKVFFEQFGMTSPVTSSKAALSLETEAPVAEKEGMTKKKTG